MRTRPTILFFSPDAGSVPPLLGQWAQSHAFPLRTFQEPEEIHAIVLRGGEVSTLDFFVAVPGLGAEPQALELEHLEVPFGTELVHYAVGIGSCGVPGVLAGLGELWRRDGSLPWARLVEPALRLAHEGTDFPRAHAACLEMLAPVLDGALTRADREPASLTAA